MMIRDRRTQPWLFAPTLMLVALVAAAAAAPAWADDDDPEVVDHVDLERYSGKWYEIACIPNMFQRGCTRTIARYQLRDDGKLEVINSCRKGGLDAEPSFTDGTARVTDEKTNAKLRVRFFWPLSVSYWIIGLDEEYQWAIVGTPDRDNLWIISRTPTIDEQLYQELVDRAAAQGYDVSELERTLHPEAKRTAQRSDGNASDDS
jgi:apolipoprotein D and lipocalin family protein